MDDKKNLLLSDTLVPDLFISEYMSGLSLHAVQCYLYLRMTSGGEAFVVEKDLSARLSLTKDEIKGALTELSYAGLLEWKEGGAPRLCDIKAVEIEGYIKRRMEETPIAGAPEIAPENEERDSLARSIEKTFFHGSMAYKWYREIDILLDDFAFDAQVVYKLFQVCSAKNQLGALTQMKELALAWQARGIRTMEQLSAYLAGEEIISLTLRRLARKLHRKMVSYDEECVREWIEKLGYDFDTIDFAIHKIWEYQEPSVNKADTYLKAWHAAGVRTLSDAKAFEADVAKRNKLAYQQNKTARNEAPNGQNFDGVKYDDAFLRSLEVDPVELVKRLKNEKPAEVKTNE